MKQIIRALRGMNDILPEEAVTWQALERELSTVVESFGYRLIRTPILEQSALFCRAIGEVTDIVEKEMYAFEDRLNGENLTLRPEATASIVRSVIEHNMLHAGAQRLYYTGPMFRHERPQKGRYRQFHQFGVEAIGFVGPDVDAELIAMTARMWKILELKDITLELNSLGDIQERVIYRQQLIAYLEQHQHELDEEAQRRMYTNPLRVLDSKNPQMQLLIEQAPKLSDYLGEETKQHFAQLLALLDIAEIPYVINPRLVRGLDYYNRTVFEWTTTQLGAQATFCAGGRYDGLIEQLGGKSAAAVGFAIGLERVLAMNPKLKSALPPDGYVVHAGEGSLPYAFKLADYLRSKGLRIILNCGGGSFKSQMKKADASQANYALVIGEQEVQTNQVTLKALRSQVEQKLLDWQQLVEFMIDIRSNGE